MKEFFKKLWEKLYNKTVLVFLLGAILGAAGVSIDSSVIEKFVCLFNVAGCQ